MDREAHYKRAGRSGNRKVRHRFGICIDVEEHNSMSTMRKSTFLVTFLLYSFVIQFINHQQKNTLFNF